MSPQQSPADNQGPAPTGLNLPAQSALTGLHRAAPVNTPEQIQASNHGPAVQAAPTPLAKRPKGRMFVITVLMALVGVVCYSIYTSYFSTIAYGSVKARVIRVSPKHEGTVQTVHVANGDQIRQGDLLVTLENAELRRQLERAGDRLKIARSELDAERVRLKLEAQRAEDAQQQRSADHYRQWSSLQNEQAALTNLEKELEITKQLVDSDVATTVEYEAIERRFELQQKKVDSLNSQVERLKQQVDQPNALDTPDTLIKPKQVAINAIQDEMQRLEGEIEECKMTSPVSGKVVNLNRLGGEQAAVGETIVEVVEEGSIEIELFLLQSQIDDFAVGSDVKLLVNSGREVMCEVKRVGMQFQNPPSNLVRFYPSQAKVVPVYLQPSPHNKEQIALFLDSQVRLPRRWLMDGLFEFAKSENEPSSEPVNRQSRRQAALRADAGVEGRP